MTQFTILSSALALPEQQLASLQIDLEFDLPAGTVERESGVRTRYRAEPGVTPSALGAAAANNALRKAGLRPSDIDIIIYAGASPDQLIPCNAIFLHRKLEASPHALCFDIDQTCMSFVTAFNVVDKLLGGDATKTALIVSSEIASRGLNRSDLKTYSLFGDGAVAYIIKGGGSSFIKGSMTRTISEYAEACALVGGGVRLPGYEYTGNNRAQYLFHMDGRTLFKAATKHLRPLVDELLSSNGLTMSDITLTVPHQASLSAMRLLQRGLGITSQDCMEIIQEYGNCIAASIPMALHIAMDSNRLKKSDIALLIGAGAGVTLSASLLVI